MSGVRRHTALQQEAQKPPRRTRLIVAVVPLLYASLGTCLAGSVVIRRRIIIIETQQNKNNNINTAVLTTIRLVIYLNYIASYQTSSEQKL